MKRPQRLVGDHMPTILDSLNRFLDDSYRRFSEIRLPFLDAKKSVTKGDVRATWAVATFTASDTDTLFPHDLNSAKVNFIPGVPSAAIHVYEGESRPTDKGFYLRCKFASGVTSATLPVLVWRLG